MEPKKPKKFPNDKSGKLFDTLRKRFDLSSDVALSNATSIAATTISRIRHGTLAVSGTNKLAIYRATKMPIEEIEKLIGKQ